MNKHTSSFYYNDGPVKQGMYTFEDEDSRDSGIGDMDCGPSTLKSVCGEQLFVLDEEMGELNIDENSAKISRKPSKGFSRRPRAFGEVTNMQDTSPLSRRGGMYRTKSSMLPRKRTLPDLEYQPKRQKENEKDKENSMPTTFGASKGAVKASGRPRSLLRALSTSMLEVNSPHPDDNLPQPLVVKYSLTTVAKTEDSVAFRRIEASTLCELMTSLSEAEFLEKYVLVDCRYPYEYDGGHIKHAINMYDPTECEKFFFNGNFDLSRIPIFYCEYSQKRGPGMATTLRGVDRVRNVDNYPNVTFKEIYVLDKGYKGFYHNQTMCLFDSKALCSPVSYVSMDDPQYTQILKSFSFHKRYSTTATCIKPESQSRIQRQLSLESPTGRRIARRPLFTVTESPAPSLQPQKLIFSPETPSS